MIAATVAGTHKMRFKRAQRVQELLLEEISNMLQHGLNDPRIGFVTITSIDLSDNLKHANVYVSIMGDEAQKEGSLEGLKSARGFIRQRLGKALHLRAIPELEFKLDRSIDHAAKINQLIHRIHQDDE